MLTLRIASIRRDRLITEISRPEPLMPSPFDASMRPRSIHRGDHVVLDAGGLIFALVRHLTALKETASH